MKKRFIPFLLAACLGLLSISCMAVSSLLFEPTPTPLPTRTPVTPTLTPTTTPIPSPVPTITPTPDYCPNGDCISACLDLLPVIARPGAGGNGLKGSLRVDENGKRYLLTTYTVMGDTILDPIDKPAIPKNTRAFQEDRASQEKIWDYFRAIIPLPQRKFLSEYDIFTDGTDNVLALVSQSETDMGKWTLSVDPADASNPKDLTYTLIHEYGHLLTLNSTQVIPSQRIFDNPQSEKIYQEEFNACQTYFTGEGCSLPDSYVNKFFARFWPDIYAEWQKIDNINDRQDYYAALDAFYKKFQDQFVTDYAPTNPVEDLAETFSFFILKPRPTGDTIADQKIQFLYDFPELVALRAQIGRNLCDQLNK